MKKIILSTLFIASVVSCKKENQKTGDNAVITDSISTTDKKEPEAGKISLKETSQQELGKYFAKSNDTLYVTNFFATWCGPCMQEIPHFKNKIQELNGKAVKFTFVNIYNKPAWETEVPVFAKESGLSDKIVLLDDSKIDQNFFKNFKTWKGSGIPFTFFKRGNKTDEIEGSMSEEMLNEKINSFLQ
ncbi:thiol-disulfide isomerase/thioredoxin [Chryseobacterium ginsenosidimutans]|uniref:TlpA family protein disulfide reductase n=1 Tax=Chryseobacterium ginsenosidimutans TaxID=687846 RepID=UPI00277DBCD2|nr:TlpA family protein disulfide reductase [Chryseobacterium ginsenosidimutans]MDQ0594347.1 thiol-disulfide isomerase/thioredoxin [Chryseobacterium ginsenosidimutans]